MNKNVQNYLVEKENINTANNDEIKTISAQLNQVYTQITNGTRATAQKALAWLQEKGEEIKAKLESSALPIAKQSLKTLASILVASSLLLSSAGCDKNPTFEDLAVRSEEEIVETGITPEDVLAKYDDLCEFMLEAQHSAPSYKDKLIDDYKNFEASFTEIAPSVRHIAGEPIENPFYEQIDEYIPYQPWLTMEDSYYYIKNPQTLNNVFLVSIKFKSKLANLKSNEIADRFAVNAETMEKMLKAFNVKSYVLTAQSDSIAENPYYYGSSFNKTVYENIKIDRNTIKNATEEQLWSLYNMIDSMISLNFYGEHPQENKEYEININ